MRSVLKIGAITTAIFVQFATRVEQGRRNDCLFSISFGFFYSEVHIKECDKIYPGVGVGGWG